MAQLWGGRFAKETDKLVYDFNASITYDKRFLKQDVRGSIAHVTMLSSVDIISNEEKDLIIKTLNEIVEDVEAGKLESPADLLERLTKNPKVNYVYYPGGHFLGLSCVNSETNIKSCVNLQRICELGASMSQRREEVRGYDEEGNPKYRYYVPTGLISNVDIESATFRSMFATLNHNKLVATRTNENTGYKQYDLKFLRPDGFDGALSSYVHQPGGTPYNRKVEEDWLEDAEKNGIFKKLFGSLWTKPDDYDPEETEYTERRTVEACINDYYIFRFGLNSLNKDEQLRHFLKKDVNGYALPQYENSFYFYFGLRDGATAIDEFKKQFFSECQPNIISRTPAISVTEKISDDFTVISATLNIENMYPGYSITVKDLTTGVESDPYPIETDDEKINLGEYIEILIGHEYLVSVTDSLGRIIEKRFIFGASVMNTDVESVNFRCPGTTPTGDPKKGGYIKINDKVKVKKVEKKISEDSISVVIKKIENGTETVVSASEGSYTDMSGILWHLYYVPSVGQYNVYLDYQGASVLVYSTALVDNTEVNLFVGCDYLSYKPEFVPDTGNYLPSMNLKDFTETDWYNGVKFQNTDPDSWLLRHTFYRQYSNDALGHNCSIYNKGMGSLAIYGHPETGTMYAASNTDTGDTGQTNFVMDGPSCYRGYFTQYEGYSIEPTNTFIPTMYWSQGLGEDYTGHEYRRTFDAMTYTEDGRAAADATGLRVLSYTYSNTDGKIVLTYDGGLTDKHGCIVVFENGIIIFPIVNEADKTLTAYLDYDAYPGGVTEEILGMATIYPTMMVPVIYKPFYGIVSAATWEVQALYLPDVGNNETVPEKMALPPSFKFEADLYNGLTFNEHFYSGDTADGPYDTYLIFDNKKDFYNKLTNPDDAPLLKTETDWMWKRKATFANGKWDNGCGREIETTAQAKLNPNFTTLEYYITEGMPNITEMQSNVKSGRYSNGFDQAVLGDICDMGSAFFNDIKIKAMEESSGLTGPCAVYVEGPLPENISLYATKNTLFNRSSNPLTVTEDQINIYCYGTYNENIKYDIKGTVTTVKKSGSGSEKYYYSVTNERGERVQKIATSVTDLYNNGITLLYKYTLDDAYKKAITLINSTIASAEKIELDKILTPENQTNYKLLEPGNAYNALIAVYDKPEPQGSKNRMIVYKLYPIGALDLMFPASQGGVPAYLGLSESGNNILGPYSDEAQTIAISVKTNVRFSVSIESTDTWISITQTDYPENTISIEVNLSTNTTGAERRGTIYLQCTDPNVDLPPVPITIVQSKDRITPLEEEIEELRPPVTGRT